jgi:hypothetical protein
MPLEELQPDEAGAKPVTTPLAPKTRKALSRLKRELSDEELASPGVQKMLVEELEKVEEEKSDLSMFKEKFHQADKDLAVLKEKHRRYISAEIISGACLAVGAAALGYAPNVWAHQPSGWLAVAFGVVLTVMGIAAKAIRL